MNTTKTNNLSFYNEQGILTLNAKQFDTGRRFVFHIMDNDEPCNLSGCSACLRIAKADGTQFQGQECCNIEGSIITIDTSIGNGNQILTADGTNVCELHLENSNGISLTTWNFNLLIEPRVHDGSHISSIDSFDILDIATSNEKEREKNEEKRNEAEKNRQENEMKRETAFENFKNEIDTITDEAHSYATKAESWTVGGTNTRTGEDTDNSKHYYEQIKSIAESFSGTLRPKGTITFASLPSLSSAKEGDMYNISNQFTTNANFKEGSGHIIPSGSNIYKTADGKWDVLAGTPVTGVKGDTENTYRQGNINITPESIGSLSLKQGGTVNNNFKVNKESSTNPTGLTELDIHNDGKVAINTNGSGANNNSLAHFDGAPNTGTITLRGNELRLYEPNISLEATSNTSINHHGIAFKNASGSANLKLISNDVIINSGENGYSNKASGATFNENTGETRLYTNDINIGAGGDYFIEAYRNINGDTAGMKELKLRGGKYIDAQHQSANIQLEYDATNGNQIDFYANNYNFYSASNQNPLLRIKPTGVEIRDTSDDGFTINGNAKVTGNLRIKGSGNYGNQLNFGDSDYVYICEPDDDVLEIKATNGITLTTNNHSISFKDEDSDSYYGSISNYKGNHLKMHSDELSLAADFVYIGYDHNSDGVYKYGCFVFEPDSGLYPMSNYMTLGFSTYKWDALYANNGTIQTSDRNEKNHIEELSTEKSQRLIYGLKPSTYQMNNGTSGRTHWGMISQDIEDLLEELGWSSLDFAGFIKSPRVKEIKTVTDENSNTKKIHEYIDGVYDYSLRYDEFIAPIIKVIQTQHEEIQNQEERIDILKKKIEALEQKINGIMQGENNI